jgi:hypothetical protein
MSYNFNITITTDNFDVMVDTTALYGYFEHHRYGDELGGGLRFTTLTDGTLDLVDFDGVPSLPYEVVTALLDAGILVDDGFYE